MTVRVLNLLGERAAEIVAATAPDVEIATFAVEDVPTGLRAEVVLSSYLPAPVHERLDEIGVRWMHIAATGVDKWPRELLRGRTVTCARGISAVPIAEYVLMMILSVSRRLPQLLELQRERTWQPLEGAELRDVTVGIVGLGSIGRAVGALATAFGCRVIATRRRTDAGADAVAPEADADAAPPGSVVADRVLGPEGLSELLAESDFVVLAAPLTSVQSNVIVVPGLKRASDAGLISDGAGSGLVDAGVTVSVVVRLTPP